MIPAHNAARFVAETIESVFAQTYPELEVIVVNDGSTDATDDILKTYEPRIKVIRQTRQGVAAARNAGIVASRGEFVAFVDADDAWDREKLARQIPLFENPSVGLVHCGIRYISESGEALAPNLTGRRGRVLRDIALLRGTVVQGGGSGSVVRKECLERVGLFDPDLSTSADWDMWRRIACQYEIDMVRAPLVRYRVHASSMHQNVALFERDMLHAFAKMFVDPLAEEVYGLHRRGYGSLYLMLSGSFLHAGQWRKSLAYAGRGIATWPPAAMYLAQFPARIVSRWLFGNGHREPGV